MPDNINEQLTEVVSNSQSPLSIDNFINKEFILNMLNFTKEDEF